MLARWCVLLMLATIVLSAFMRLSQAGLGCDDWPACYGQSLRALQAGASAPVPVLAPHGVAAARLAHRVVASLALVLVLAMVMTTLLSRPVLRRPGLLALALLALALLGGFAMLALCWRLAWSARPGSAPPSVPLAGLALVLVVAQVVLGAMVSGSHSALACQGLMDCARSLPAGAWDWAALSTWREPLLSATPPFHAAGALVQLLHRLGAVLVLPAMALVAWQAWRQARRAEAAALLVLVCTQALIGPLLVGVGLPIAMVLAHNLVAACMLAALVRLLDGRQHRD